MKGRYYIILPFIVLFSVINVTNVFAKKATKVSIDTLKVDYSNNKAAVVPFQDTLFYVYGNIGAVTAKQRAENIVNHIKELEESKAFEADSFKIKVDGDNLLITFGDKTIMGINEPQSLALNKSKEEIAQEYIDIIADSISKERDRHSWKNILMQVFLSALILTLTYFSIKYVNIGCRKLVAFVRRHKDKAIKKISFILDANKQISILVILIKIIRLIIVLLILYFCLFSFFGLFPETEWISEKLISYILSPLGVAFDAVKNFIPNLFYILVIFYLFKFLVRAIKVVAEKISDGSMVFNGFYSDWAMPTFHIVRIILYVFMFILIFPHLPGAESKAFQGVSVFLGILFSLGSTSIIANIVSGIVITYMRPFKVGDRIRMGEFLGNVIEKTPLVTRIKTPKNEIITIPNGTIMSAQTINYTSSASEYGLILYTTITVNYDIPWRRVHELLIEAGLATPNVLTDPKPFVLQIALDDFYVEYQINIYTKMANEMSGIYSKLNENIQDIFIREGIELLSPHYRAQRDGSDIMIPKEFIRSGNFRTSPFNMKVTVTKEDENRNN